MPFFQGEGCSNAQAQDEDKKVSNGENDDSDDEFHDDSGYLEEWKEHDGIVFGVNGNLHVHSLDTNSASFTYSLKDNMVTVVEGDYVKFVENVKWNHTAKVTKIVSFEGGDKAPFQPTDRSQGPLDFLNYIDEVVKKAAHLYKGHHNKAIDVEFAISEEMKGCREDLRDLQTFTIDCESTLDMDDGFSVEKTDDGVIAGDVVSVKIGWKNESLELKTLSSDPIRTVVKPENPFSSSFTPFSSFTAESSWPSSGNFTDEVNNFYTQNH